MQCLQRDKQLRAPILFDGCENILQRDGLRRPETGQATNKDSFRQKGRAAHYDFHFVPIFTVQNQLQLAGSEETCVHDGKLKQSEVGKRSRQYANTFPNYLLLIISKYSVCTHGENSARCLQRYDGRVLLKDVHGALYHQYDWNFHKIIVYTFHKIIVYTFHKIIELSQDNCDCLNSDLKRKNMWEKFKSGKLHTILCA